MYKLKKKIIITGYVQAVTGLHIGGTNNSLAIGEIDNAIIRNPVNNQPYIPGSSLKGKMRSLLEVAHGTIGDRPMGREIPNPPTNDPNTLAAQLFGFTGAKVQVEGQEQKLQQPSRVIVRDGHLINVEELPTELSEVKAETVIDRITSAAMPRQLERVPAGAKFNLEIIINIFEPHRELYESLSEQQLVQGVFDSLQLLEDDYLGGSGSRGSGQVRFHIAAVKERTDDYYKSGGTEEDVLEEYATQKYNLYNLDTALASA